MARTKATVKMRDIGNRQPGMFGYAYLGLTNDDATTAVVRIGGLPFGRLVNVSGDSLEITFKELYLEDPDADDPESEGTVVALKDEDNATSQYAWTLGNNESRQLPSALAGVDWLVITLSSGTATVRLHEER